MVDASRPPEPPEPASQPEPTEPAVMRAYALPTARRVVASGLSLALASTSDLRRASIYIGLLLLGAFGPSIVALLLIVGRLGDGAMDALGALLAVEFGAPAQPALEAAVLVATFNALFGLILFVAISIDAQVIAISILGGRASDRPLRLWEAIGRARQAFWRMAGAGALVGLIGLLIQGFILAAIGGFSRSDEATSVAAALLATLVTAPLAYVATSIVLGDVGAMEALSRSWRLFRARRAVAVVVSLFTLLTSAIHLFAFGAGLDLVARAAEVLQLSLTEGALPFAAATVLILAAVVAYGSLTFTISAVVSAPQVTGFLGLTFYSGGLDRARSEAARPPRGFRYVSAPMTAAMGALLGLALLEIPAINSIPVPPASGTMALVRAAAAHESELIDVYGHPAVVVDAPGDGGSGDSADVDLVQAELAYLETVPDWLLDEFDCAAARVACGSGSVAGGAAAGTTFADGALLVLHRHAEPLRPDRTRRIVLLLGLETEVRVPLLASRAPFSGGSRAFTTELTAMSASVTAVRTSGTELREVPTAARSTWSDTDVFTLVPISELPHAPRTWDAIVLAGGGEGTGTGAADGLRSGWQAPLVAWDWSSTILADDYR